MTQTSLAFDAKPAPTDTFTAAVADLFKRYPNQWIDGLEVAKVGGVYAYRTRISDCRRAPFNLTIENRQRMVEHLATGRKYKVSEYRLVVDNAKA